MSGSRLGVRRVAYCSVVRSAELLISEPRSSLNDLPRSDSINAGESAGRLKESIGMDGGP